MHPKANDPAADDEKGVRKFPTDIRPLSRLSGLETEYAIHFHRPKLGLRFTTKGSKEIFEELFASLQKKIPIAPPKEEKKGGYLANGCAIWYEAIPWHPLGLFEAATPECVGPHNVVAASRGLDGLLIDATNSLSDSDARLLKNCVDPRGNTYGAQENYEVIAFEAGEQKSWGRKMHFLLAVTYFTLFLMLACGSMLVFLPIEIASAVLGDQVPQTILLLALFALLSVLPGVRSRALLVLVSVLLIPKSIAVSLVCRYSKLGRTYRKLAPFLVSRVVFCGAGLLDQKGRFSLGQKAASISTDWLVGLVSFQQSIFSFNPIFKNLMRQATGESTNLRSQRQRLCIGIGDSNMCEEAEYLRVATTTLVIDAIEAGFIDEFPELKGTVKCLHAINKDPELNVLVSTSMGEMTAIQIQQFYLDACRRYLRSIDDAPDEAFEILTRWSEVLYCLRSDHEQLFGRIDWITKRELMRHAAKRDDEGELVASLDQEDSRRHTHLEFSDHPQLASLRKIDVKYHELSRDGYYQRLVTGGLSEAVFAEEVLERAGRMPPLSVLAAQRCHYIREFAGEIEWVRWEAVKLNSCTTPIVFSREIPVAR